MQSSWIVTCRALVVLVCLIALPLAAITGTSRPGLVEAVRERGGRILDGALRGSEPVAGRATRPTGEPAPPFDPVSAPISTAEGGNPSRSDLDSTTGPHRDPAHPPVRLATLERSAPPPGPPEDADETAEPESSQTLAPLTQRLRDLGATYYLLEKWGDEGALYRFHCRVALADRADQVRYFEATAGAPARALRDVLGQVEAWRSAAEGL